MLAQADKRWRVFKFEYFWNCLTDLDDFLHDDTKPSLRHLINRKVPKIAKNNKNHHSLTIDQI